MSKEEIREWVTDLIKDGVPRDEAWDVVGSILESQDGYKKCHCEDYPCCGH